MKIGILSMQRVFNYGSFLQAYALKKILEERGHEIQFIDIDSKQVYLNNDENHLFLKKIGYLDKYILKRIEYRKKNKLLNNIFLESQKKYLNLTDNHMFPRNCDAVIIGSDEIFNCSPISKWGISGQRFGDIIGVDNIISYAASCGYTGLEDLIEDEDKKIISSALNKMKLISVRDFNTYKFAKALSDKRVEINLDPVCIYDFISEMDQGEKLGVPKKPYLIIYAYHNRIESKGEIKAIKDFSKKNGLKTIAIGGSQPWCDEFAVLSPFQVLAYFKNASFIITDTFHGTILSSKYNKPFAVIMRDSNKNKLGDLLMRLQLEEHRLDEPNKLSEILLMENNYNKFNDIVKKEKQRTRTFFNEAGF